MSTTSQDRPVADADETGDRKKRQGMRRTRLAFTALGWPGRGETPLTAAANPWDPKQDAQFRAERGQPFYDLMALVEIKLGMRVVDLGCGCPRERVLRVLLPQVGPPGA
jgi:hypothetical protein